MRFLFKILIITSLVLTPSLPSFSAETNNCIFNLEEGKNCSYLPSLIDGLKNQSNEKLRVRAAVNIGRIGPTASKATLPLIESLSDNIAFVRSEAATALGLIGKRAKSAIEKLTHLLNEDVKDFVRSSAIKALVKIIPNTKDLVQTLIVSLKNSFSGIRSYAVKMLGNLGAEADIALPDLNMAAANDNDLSVKESANVAIELIKKANEKFVEENRIAEEQANKNYLQILENLKNLEDSSLRKNAIEAIGGFGPAAREAIPELLIALKDSDPNIKNASVLALSKMGRFALPALISLLTDSDTSVRMNAAFAIGLIGPEAKEAVSALIYVLKKDIDKQVRKSAAEALANIGEEAEMAIPTLINALEMDEDFDVRNSSAKALGEIGVIAKQATTALRKSSEINELRDNSILALRKIEIKFNFVLDNLASSDNYTKKRCLDIIYKIGPEAKEAIPSIINILTDENEFIKIRDYSAWVLGGFRENAKDAVPALINYFAELRDSGNNSTKLKQLIIIFDKIGSSAEIALPVVKDFIENYKLEHEWNIEELKETSAFLKKI